MKGIFLCRCQLSIERQLAFSARANCLRFKSPVSSGVADTGVSLSGTDVTLCGLAERLCAVIANSDILLRRIFTRSLLPAEGAAKPVFYPNLTSDAGLPSETRWRPPFSLNG